MKDEFELELAKSFPFMRRKENIDEQKAKKGKMFDLYGAFGCDVGNGWYSVLYGLCDEITKAYEEAGIEVDVVPIQIKEKFGELCFYYETPNADSSLQKTTNDIVEKWEEKSATVCERCGQPGQLRTDLSWVLTLCDDCYEQQKSKYKNRG
ncbi:MAG: hypothetical protein ACI4IG_01165 [Eubacterium sp.]